MATALYLATKSNWGTWQAGFHGNLDLRQTYTEATNLSVNAAVLRMESGTSATIDGNLTVGLDAATKIDPQAMKSSVSLAQGIRIYNYPGMSFQPQGSLTVSGQTAISVANGQYASVGIVTISSYSSAYDPYGSRAGDITLQFGSKELTAPALNIDVKRGRNAIGILFATEDKDSSMTVLGDTVIKAGFAEKMLNDNADSSKTFSKIVNSKDGDIANIGLWNEKGTNVFDGKLQINLFAANEKDTLNFGIVSDGGVVSVKDGLIIDAYAGENENSDLLDSGSDRFRAIELMNGASLEVHSRENASVIRSNIYLRGEGNTLSLDFDREGAVFEGNIVADNPNKEIADALRKNSTTLLFKNGGRWVLDRDNYVKRLIVGNGGVVRFDALEGDAESFRPFR